MERFMALKANFLGIQYVPIAFNGNSQTRSVSIAGILDSMWRGVRPGQTDPMRLENWQPWIPSLVMAKGTGNTYKDHGMDWPNKGKNGYYAQFQWP